MIKIVIYEDERTHRTILRDHAMNNFENIKCHYAILKFSSGEELLKNYP
ncbi:hypothetical protein [Gottschalkia acidurici]|nr:hypothetical protein [Gottschalkia acidurici]